MQHYMVHWVFLLEYQNFSQPQDTYQKIKKALNNSYIILLCLPILALVFLWVRVGEEGKKQFLHYFL